MKKLLTLLVITGLSLTTVVGCKGRSTTENCDKADGTKACYNADKEQYLIEDGAKIRIGVDSDKWGQAIVSEWNKKYPDHKGMLEYINYGTQGAASKVTDQQAEAPDVLLVIDGETIPNSTSFYVLDDHVANIAKENSNESVFNAINKGATTYIPVAVDGLTFVWNKTMLTELGLDPTDANGDNLPDAYDTWEEIFALADSFQAKRPTYKGKKVNVVFPIPVKTTWDLYSSLTAGGWEIFSENDPLKPGYDKEEFLKGLEFVAEAGKHYLSVETGGAKTPGDSMGARWDEVLFSEISPFGLTGTWMDVTTAEQSTGADFVFSPLPKYKDVQLTPFFKTKGWVINGYTKYPSAAHEVIRFLYSKEGLDLMVKNSTYVPALKDNASVTPDLKDDKTKEEMQKAFTTNYLEPAGLTLPNNPTKSAMSVYYELQLENIFTQVYDGKLTPADAQKQIENLAKEWYNLNNK